MEETKAHTYGQREQLTKNAVTAKLFKIMESKKTNLCVAADVTTKKELLKIADEVGPEICALKLHIDIIDDFDKDLVDQLQAMAQKHNFLLIEDRKFADIGSTVQSQYAGGVHRIVEWADIVIAHVISGPDIIKALKEVANKKKLERGVLVLAQMSSAGNLIDEKYTQEVVNMAGKYPDYVIGFIAQKACCQDRSFVVCTPGINLAQKGDNLGQQYNTPDHAIAQQGSDIIIVGRAIYNAKDPQAVAQDYRKQGWEAYQNRLRRNN